MSILVIAILIGLMILAGCRIKAVSNISLGILSVIKYICYGVFILVWVAAIVGGSWWLISTYIL